MRKILSSLLLAAVAIAAPASAQKPASEQKPAASKEPKLEFQTFRLANGLTVILHEDHATPQVAVVTWFRVGSKDELPGKTGFAHLFEHLMFKGSKHVPDGKMDILLEGAGGWSNAFTSNNETVYQNLASSNFLEMALYLDADRFAGLLDTFDQAKLDNQRDVVLNERRLRIENVPYGKAEERLPELLWPKGFGYHWTTIGYQKDLDAASQADVRKFFQNYYTPNNAVMVIAGDIDPVKTKALVEKYLGWLPAGPDADKLRPHYAAPAPITKEVRETLKDKVQVPRVYIQWRTPKEFSKEEPALELAGAILGQEKTGRLYRRLVYEQRLAQDVDAGNFGEDLGGTFQITATAKPGVASEKLTAAITEEVARLAKEPPTPLELEQAKNLREAAFLTRLESGLRRAIQLAEYQVKTGNPDFLAADLARYRAVTGEQVSAAVAKYLTPQSRVVLTVVPEAPAKEKK